MLGDFALGVLDPDEVSRKALRNDWEVLPCPFHSPPAVAARWLAHREFPRVPSLAALPAAVALARRIPPRLTPSMTEWAGDWLRACSCGTCPSFLRAAVPLRKATERAWALRLGLEVPALRQHLLDCLGVRPLEVLTRWKQRACSLGSGLGWTGAQIADALGVSGPRSLRRAKWSAAAGAATPTRDVENATLCPLPPA